MFVGGGVALGPRPVKRILSLSNDIKNKAKFMAFALKADEKQLVMVSGISKLVKTKEASHLLKNLEKETKARRFTFVLSEKATEAAKCLRNLKNSSFVFYKNANALDVFRGGMIIIDDEIFENQAKSEKKETKLSKKEAKASK
jgi:ribosomal protein L4